MKAVLRLECIGDDVAQILAWFSKVEANFLGIYDLPPRKGYWVAEIIGKDYLRRYNRRFLSYKKDYSQANSVGSRGVYAEYYLDEGLIYEVSSPASWSRIERYFCTVSGGEVVKLDEDVVTDIMEQRLQRQREATKCRTSDT